MLELERMCVFKNYGWLYDDKTGIIKSHTGRINNKPSKNGYIRCKINKNKETIAVLAHRLAWYLTYNELPNIIDHINHDKKDNRINNLRSVTTKQNTHNRTSLGYYYNKKSGKFQTQIMVNYESIYLGSFNTEIEAKQSYLNAKEIYHKIDTKIKIKTNIYGDL